MYIHAHTMYMYMYNVYMYMYSGMYGYLTVIFLVGKLLIYFSADFIETCIVRVVTALETEHCPIVEIYSCVEEERNECRMHTNKTGMQILILANVHVCTMYVYTCTCICSIMAPVKCVCLCVYIYTYVS